MGRPARATNGAVATTRPTSMKRSAVMTPTSEIPEADDHCSGPPDEPQEDPGAQQRAERTHQGADDAADQPTEDHAAQQQRPGDHPLRGVAPWWFAHLGVLGSSWCVITPTGGRAR